MYKNDGKDAFSETDPFWDLELLLPKSEKKVYPSEKFDTSTKDFRSELSPCENSPQPEKIPKRSDDEKFPPITKTQKSPTGRFDAWLAERKRLEQSRGLRGKKVLETYIPDIPLIKSVSISAEEFPVRTGERFLSDAHKLYGLEGDFKGNVPFESYYPQYSQMTPEQTECYIGFRSAVRAGSYPEVDKAYIYLYLYELINLTNQSAEERALAICGLINGYSDCETRLFSDMCNWLCDICLIYKVTLPADIFGKNIFRVTECASIKEFYIRTERGFDAGIAFLLTCGKYDYRKSRFYPENKQYYDKYINSSVGYALKEISKNDSRFAGADESVCTLSHESYFGALCTAAVRRTVTLECICVTRSESVRNTVTELTKYAENTLRKRLGITPRLTVSALTLDRKELIKSYFGEKATELPNVRKRLAKLKDSVQSAKEVPMYEHLYEPKTSGVSFEQAEEIEKMSWQITKKLVSEENAELETEAQNFESEIKIPEKSETDRVEFLRCALKILHESGSGAYCEFVCKQGEFSDSVADEINEMMYEKVFDIVIEVGECYRTVSDYGDEIREFIYEK